MITNLVLLSGGLATRLHPISHSIPKSLIDIKGRPFIEYQLSYFKKQGITDIVLCLGHLGEKIEEFVGDGKKFGINVKYSYDGDKLLATGHGMKDHAKEFELEKCETRAIGRALAIVGIGLDAGIASYDEMADFHRQNGEQRFDEVTKSKYEELRDDIKKAGVAIDWTACANNYGQEKPEELTDKQLDEVRKLKLK